MWKKGRRRNKKKERLKKKEKVEKLCFFCERPIGGAPFNHHHDPPRRLLEERVEKKDIKFLQRKGKTFFLCRALARHSFLLTVHTRCHNEYNGLLGGLIEEGFTPFEAYRELFLPLPRRRPLTSKLYQ